jgi:hypothetical protein
MLVQYMRIKFRLAKDIKPEEVKVGMAVVKVCPLIWGQGHLSGHLQPY